MANLCVEYDFLVIDLIENFRTNLIKDLKFKKDGAKSPLGIVDYGMF